MPTSVAPERKTFEIIFMCGTVYGARAEMHFKDFL